MARKIKLHGSPTTKELKKKHSFRLVGGVEMGSWSGEDTWQGGVGGGSGLVRWQLVDQCRQGGGWQTRQSHICVQINWEEQLRSWTDHTTQSSSWGNKPQTSGCKNPWGLQWQNKLPASQ